jgi:pimeloyl-ACP methyl ester carboxylesterase
MTAADDLRAADDRARDAAPGDATAADEWPVFIDSPRGELFAIVTEPPTRHAELGIVMIRGGGWRPSSGPRRTQVRTCRRLAGRGFRAVRLSYRGIAESGGEMDPVFRLDRPYVEDVDAAVDFLAGLGTASVLIGNCFGARSALAAAAARPEIRGVALIVPPVHDFEVTRQFATKVAKQRRRLRRDGPWAVLRNPARRKALARTARGMAQAAAGRVRSMLPGAGPPWVSRAVVDQLGRLASQQTPVLVVYGDADQYGSDFEQARAGKLGRVLDRAGDGIRVVVVPGSVHGQADRRTQAAVLETVERWLLTTFPAAGPHR